MGTVDGILLKVTPQSSYLSACTRFWATPSHAANYRNEDSPTVPKHQGN